MSDPRQEKLRLYRHGLPLGPLGRPLRFWSTEHGKLHNARNCRSITSRFRDKLVERQIALSDLTRMHPLCSQCNLGGHPAARRHVVCGNHVINALGALAKAGVSSPYSDSYDKDAKEARDKIPTWLTVGDLDRADHRLASLEEPHVHADQGEMENVVGEVLALIAKTRAEVVARLPLEDWAHPEAHRTVVGVRNYANSRQLRNRAALFARTEIACAGSSLHAFAFAPPAIADDIPGGINLGPARSGDTTEVFGTALRLLGEDRAINANAITETSLVAGNFAVALDLARGIHAPVRS